jgi:hypothetical protein
MACRLTKAKFVRVKCENYPTGQFWRRQSSPSIRGRSSAHISCLPIFQARTRQHIPLIAHRYFDPRRCRHGLERPVNTLPLKAPAARRSALDNAFDRLRIQYGNSNSQLTRQSRPCQTRSGGHRSKKRLGCSYDCKRGVIFSVPSIACGQRLKWQLRRRSSTSCARSGRAGTHTIGRNRLAIAR